MSNDLMVSNGTRAMKTFWGKTEGKVGLVVLGGVAVGVAGTFWFKALPYLVKMAEDTAKLAILGSFLVVFGIVVTNPRFLTAMSYLFKGAMWHLTNCFVNLDPVGIVQAHLETLNDYIADMSKELGKLQGLINRLGEKITARQTQIDEANSTVVAAVKNPERYRQLAMVNGRQAERLEKSQKSLQALMGRAKNAHQVLSRVKEASEIKYFDMKNQVELAVEDREIAKGVGAVLNSAIKILKGGAGKDLYDAAMEKMACDTSMEMGRLENFLQETRGIFDQLDLEDEASFERTLAKIESWEQSEVIAIPFKPVATVPVASVTPATENVLLSELLKNKR